MEAAQAFDEARKILGHNQTARRLEGHPDDDNPWIYHDPQQKVIKALAEMGQTRFINLARSYQDSRVALALYAGNGIVAKIIPADHLPTSRAIYYLPAIKRIDVQTERQKFKIKFYPWVSGRDVDEKSVERLGAKIADLGLSFTEGDGHPRNVHCLPDGRRTLVGIDSYMYRGTVEDLTLIDAWHAYIHELFPIYKTGEIPPQTKDTDFSFFSIHDPNTDLWNFDHREPNPVSRTAGASAKEDILRDLGSPA